MSIIFNRKVNIFILLSFALLNHLGCAERGATISHIVKHYESMGFDVEIIHEKKRERYERNSGNYLDISILAPEYGGKARKALKQIREQESYLVMSTPITIVRFKGKPEAEIAYAIFRDIEVRGKEFVSKMYDYSEFVDMPRHPVFTKSLRNGEFIAVIHLCKIDENGRIRTTLGENNVMVGMIQNAFDTFTIPK